MDAYFVVVVPRLLSFMRDFMLHFVSWLKCPNLLKNMWVGNDKFKICTAWNFLR